MFETKAEKTVNFGAIYFPFIISTKPKADNCMREVISQDEAVTKIGELAPCYHMGLYRKTEKAAPTARKWSDEEVEVRLKRTMPPLVAIWEKFKESQLGLILRRFKRRFA